MTPLPREGVVAGLLLALLLGLAVFAPAFYQPQPLLSLCARTAPVLVVAGGMALVLILRQIDISVGSQFSVCGVVTGLLAAWQVPVALLLPAAMALGAILGAVNGALVAGLGLPSIVVTLATMVAWREGLRWLRQGVWVDLPDGFQWFGLTQTTGQLALLAMALSLFGALLWGTQRLALGRFLYAAGSDAEAARLAGLRPRRLTFGAFVLVGALTGLAAMLNGVQSPQIDPNAGVGLELRVVAAAIVGGVSVSGGRGRLGGVLAGVLLLACLGPALTYLRVEAYWEKAVQGGAILLAALGEGRRLREGRGT